MIGGKGEEIDEDLCNATLIAQHDERRGGQVQGEVLTPLLDVWAQTASHIVNEGVQIHRSLADHYGLCFCARQIEQIIDECHHALGIALDDAKKFLLQVSQRPALFWLE